jgi:uracil-DNA glycosylase family 4
MSNYASNLSAADQLAALHDEIRACRACEASGHLAAARPIRHLGRVTDRVFLIGQAPGARSDAARRHFIGPGGDTLERWFGLAGFPDGYFRTQVYISAMTRCFPGKSPGGKGDRVPSPAELALCRPFLERELALIRPRLVVLVGGLAIRTFLGRSRLEDVVGTLHEAAERSYLPLPHPSPVSRWLNDPEHRRRVDRAIELLARCRVERRLDG